MVAPSTTSDAIRQSSSSLLNHTQRRGAAPDTLGKSDFLNLMMTQLKNQDPLNPLDSDGMMQQLTQLGALEQLTNMNQKLDTLNQGQIDLVRTNAYSFLDKDVTVNGALALVQLGASPGVQFQLPRESAEVKVVITDPSGKPVRTLALGQTAPGWQSVPWDARDADGDTVLDGAYRYNVIARSSEGDSVPVKLFTRGKVSAVRFDGGRPRIELNGREFDLKEVTGVSRESARLFAGRQPYPLREEMQQKPLADSIRPEAQNP